MFSASCFFTLAQKYVKNGDVHRLGILKILMNHYFDSLNPNYLKSNVITIPRKNTYSIFDVKVVLSDVGYSNYTVNERKKFYVITLKNTL